MAIPSRTAAFIAILFLAQAFPAFSEPDDAVPFATLDEKVAWFHGLLTDEDPEARIEAAQWLAEQGDPAGEKILVEDFRRERETRNFDHFPRVWRCLSGLRCREIVPDLIQELEASPSDEVVDALGRIANDDARAALARLARGTTPLPPEPEPDPDSLEARIMKNKHRNPEAVRLRAALALVAVGETSFLPQVEQALYAGPLERKAVTAFLASMDPPLPTDIAWEMCWDARELAPLACFRAQMGLDGQSTASALRRALAAGDPDNALALASLFAQAGDVEVRELCMSQIDSDSPLRRGLAVFTLGKIGAPVDVERLAALLRDESPILATDERRRGATLSDLAVDLLAERGKESAGIVRELLTRPEEENWNLAARIAAGAPGHGLSRELLTAARAAHEEDTRERLIDACANEPPAKLTECVPLLADLLNLDPERPHSEVVEILKRTGSVEATRVIAQRLSDLGRDDSRLVEALGELGHAEGIAAIEAYARDGESRDRALHRVAPDQYPSSLGQMREEADARAKVWDYEGMMAAYDRATDLLAHRWHADSGVAVPEDCTISTTENSERSFLSRRGDLTEIVKHGKWIDVVWNEQRLGTLTESQFARLWRVATTLMQSVEACAAAAEFEDREVRWAAHVVLHVDVAIPTAGGGTAWTWRIDSESGNWNPKLADIDVLVTAYRELIEGQRTRCKRIATEAQQEMLHIRADAKNKYLRRCRLDWYAPTWSSRESNAAPDPTPFTSTRAAGGSTPDLPPGASDPNPWRRLDAVLALENAADEDARAGLKAAQGDPFFLVREGAAWVDFRRRSRGSTENGTDPALECMLTAPNWAAREAAARSWESESRGRAERLRALLQSPEPDLRMLGARLCTSAERKELEPLLQALVERDPYTVVGDGCRVRRPKDGRIHPVSIAATAALKPEGR